MNSPEMVLDKSAVNSPVNSPVKSPDKALDRLKILINSSTPILVMETVEEVRAVSLVRIACSQLNLPIYEWTIADGLIRSGSGAVAGPPVQSISQPRTDASKGSGSGSGSGYGTAMYNTADP